MISLFSFCLFVCGESQNRSLAVLHRVQEEVASVSPMLFLSFCPKKIRCAQETNNKIEGGWMSTHALIQDQDSQVAKKCFVFSDIEHKVSPSYQDASHKQSNDSEDYVTHKSILSQYR